MKLQSYEALSKHWKRYLVSSLVTFLAGFAMAVIPVLDKAPMGDTLTWGALVGMIMVGVRAGVKLVLEAFVAWWSNRK